LTKRTRAIRTAKPGDADARARWDLSRSSLDDLAHDLMAGNDPRLLRRQLAFHDVKVCAAHAARPHAQQHLSRAKVRLSDINNLHRTFCNRRRRSQDGGFHQGLPAS
jgi:hypothetical protein